MGVPLRRDANKLFDAGVALRDWRRGQRADCENAGWLTVHEQS